MSTTWKGADGIERNVADMTPMHLAMVCKQLEANKGHYNDFKIKDFGARVINSDLTVEEWIQNTKDIKSGKYKFYEDSKELNAYYTTLVNKYQTFLAPRCLQFKAHYADWMSQIADRSRLEQTCAENWFKGNFEAIKNATV